MSAAGARATTRPPKTHAVAAACTVALVFATGCRCRGPAPDQDRPSVISVAKNHSTRAPARRNARPPDDGYVLIRGGTFTMGSGPDEPSQDPGWETRHEVTLSYDFYMSPYEVTQGEWNALMESSGARFKDCGARCPMETVSWLEAVTYANALSRFRGLEEYYRLKGPSGDLGGGCEEWIANFYCFGDFRYDAVEFVGLGCTGYRLPTEAEWEYAARAGTGTTTYAGNLEIFGDCLAPELYEIAWYCKNWNRAEGAKAGPTAVGSLKPNAWGLYDMLGNVFEWVFDGAGYYSEVPVTDPLGPSVDAKAIGSRRINRGGDWSNRADEMRAAHRRGHLAWRRGDDTGFRLVRTVRK